jgi:hypothetical protein
MYSLAAQGGMLYGLDTPRNLVLGLLAGLVFGFLLQRGGLTRYRVIVRQLLLADFTVLRVMLTAVVVGSIGVYGLRELLSDRWAVGLHVKAFQPLANVIGGLIFGAGMALLGYCPGTGAGALGDGSRHAIGGVVGMLVGAGLYAEVYPWFQRHVLAAADLGKVTAADVSGASIWFFIAPLAVGVVVLLYWLRNKDAPAGPAAAAPAPPMVRPAELPPEPAPPPPAEAPAEPPADTPPGPPAEEQPPAGEQDEP